MQMQVQIYQKPQRRMSPVWYQMTLNYLGLMSIAGSKPDLKTSENTRPAASSNLGGRGPRTPRRTAAQTTRLEAIDDSLGPLGPLGENSSIASEPEHPPVPPSKEQSLPIRSARQHASSQSPLSRSMIDPVDPGDDDKSVASRTRHSSQAPSSPSGAEVLRRQTQPSVSIEQAARPSFDITVGDPHKVGDITSSHIVYQVRTKVQRGRPLVPINQVGAKWDADVLKSI